MIDIELVIAANIQKIKEEMAETHISAKEAVEKHIKNSEIKNIVLQKLLEE